MRLRSSTARTRAAQPVRGAVTPALQVHPHAHPVLSAGPRTCAHPPGRPGTAPAEHAADRCRSHRHDPSRTGGRATRGRTGYPRRLPHSGPPDLPPMATVLRTAWRTDPPPTSAYSGDADHRPSSEPACSLPWDWSFAARHYVLLSRVTLFPRVEITDLRPGALSPPAGVVAGIRPVCLIRNSDGTALHRTPAPGPKLLR
jgi:hypothetical protein